MTLSRLSLFAAAVLIAAACGSDTTAPDPATATFATALNVNVGTMTKTASGLYYRDSIVGGGTQAKSGDSITVNYIGWLTNGTKFDASADHGGTYSLRIGIGRVIAGWDEGIVGMKVGGWRKLVIPSSLGYGSGGSPPVIPGNAILVFNVQLVAIR